MKRRKHRSAPGPRKAGSVLFDKHQQRLLEPAARAALAVRRIWALSGLSIELVQPEIQDVIDYVKASTRLTAYGRARILKLLAQELAGQRKKLLKRSRLQPLKVNALRRTGMLLKSAAREVLGKSATDSEVRALEKQSQRFTKSERKATKRGKRLSPISKQ